MGCVLARDGKNECFYGLVAGTLRVSAKVVPRSVGAMRFVCDTPVPTFLLSREVQIREETINCPHGRMSMEWVLPTKSAESKEGDESPTPRFKDCKSPTPRSKQVDPGSPTPSIFSRSTAPSEGPEPEDFSRIMLYLHGGAYVLCTPATLRGVTSPLSRACGMALCVPDYRRPPECRLDAALEDAIAAYRHLVSNYPQAEIFLGGESAGGGLAASMLAALRESDLPLPSGVLLMSPWTDLGGEGGKAGLRNATLENAKSDYLPLDLINIFAECARGDLPHDMSPASPVHADGSLADLPPILVLYGMDEVLCGQIEHFCEAWRGKGARVQQYGVKGGLHAPLLFHFCHDDSHKSLNELEQFFRGNDLA